MNNASAVEALLFAALEKSNEAERAAFLDSACDGDVELRGQVEKLLRAHADVGDFLQKPAVEQLAGAQESPDATQAHDPSTDHKGGKVTQSASDNDNSDLSFLQPPTRPDSLGRLGHYEVLQVLGRGGFGIVFRAFDEVLQRVVALKVLTPHMAAMSPARKRFLREARSSAQVRHDNVVQVYEVGEQPLPYLVMEFIPGETLQQRLDRVGPLDVPETLRIGKQIAEGLAAAHATDLIHRDIKPANMLLEGGQHKVKITDFGLARAADDASLTQSGMVAGTPMYMAPEQAEGQTLDQRADLFSLGSVLYTMISGRPPFRASTTVAVLKRVAEDRPRAIRELIPETPQWLCDIIAKLHAKNPDDRYQSAREVADVLADCEAQLKTNSKLKDYSRIPQGKSAPSGKGKWVAAAAILLLPAIVLAVTEFAGVTHLFRDWETTPTAKEGTPKKDEQTAKIDPKVPGEKEDGDRKAAEYVLSIDGTVRVNGNDRDIGAKGDLPTGTFRLTSVGLHNNQVTDGGLAVFESCTNVTTLKLGGTQVTDAGVAHFKNCKGLTGVVLAGVKVDAGLAAFKDSNLTEINLENTPVTDTGLAHLKDCKNLKGLDVLKTKVSAAGIETLKKALPKCRIEWDGGVIEPTASVDPDRRAAEYVLSIGGTVRVDGADREIRAVAELPQGAFRLTFVHLNGNKQVADAGLAEFDNCTNVTGLYLVGCTQVTDAGLAHFKDCKALMDLRLSSTRLTDVGLAHFKDCQNLANLELHFTKVSDEGLAHLKDCKSLKGIFLEGTHVTDAGLAHLKNCKDLRQLDVPGLPITDTGLAHLKECKHLTIINLNETQVGDAGLEHLKDCKKLAGLSLIGTGVSGAGFSHLKDCNDLASLWLAGTKVNDSGLAHLKGKPLTLLWIHNTDVTDLTPLQGMPLEEIRLTPKNITKGLEILRDMKNLKTIGTDRDQAWPAAEFWERYNKGEFK